MDSNFRNGVSIAAAKGLATNPPHGTSDAPSRLHNALMHPGGWACAPGDQVRVSGRRVLGALHAGVGSDLFLERPEGISAYVNGAEFQLYSALATGGTLSGAVGMGRGVILLPGAGHAGYIGTDGLAVPEKNAISVRFYNGTGTPPAGPYYQLTQGSVANFPSNDALALRLIPVRGPDAPAPSPYLWPTDISIPAGTYTGALFDVVFHNLNGVFNIYHDGQAFGEARALHFAASNVDERGRLATTFAPPRGPALFSSPIATENMYVHPAVSEYHQARVFVAGGSARRFDPLAGEQGLDVPSNRLFYSETIANITATSLPFFAEDQYFDVPFKISKGIVALQSAGRYLYIFGEREVVLLSGFDDTSWNMESIGDSIGAVQAGSVQRLQNAALYLSDSGVMLLQGGQVADISSDVRDVLWGMNADNISSTVDFARELYLISDGTTTLVYHHREQGWATRQVQNIAQRLVYGGGLPYTVAAGYLLSQDSPQLLPMTIEFGPLLGLPDWGKQTTWRGAQAGFDADAVGVTLSAQLSGVMTGESGQNALLLTNTASTTSTAPGITSAHFHLADAATGAEMTAVLAKVSLTLTPTTTTRRCLLRPPINLMNSSVREATSR